MSVQVAAKRFREVTVLYAIGGDSLRRYRQGRKCQCAQDKDTFHDCTTGLMHGDPSMVESRLVGTEFLGTSILKTAARNDSAEVVWSCQEDSRVRGAEFLRFRIFLSSFALKVYAGTDLQP